MNNPVIRAIMDRRSIRAYKDRPLPKDQLQLLIDCAVNAPSARNLQPWHLVMVTDASLLRRMDEAACQEGAKTIAPLSGPDATISYHAPATLFVAGDAANSYSAADCGHLAENVCLAAHALGLGTCIIGMWRFAFASTDGKDFLKELGIPDGYDVVYGISIGYPDQAPDAKPRSYEHVAWVE